MQKKKLTGSNKYEYYEPILCWLPQLLTPCKQQRLLPPQKKATGHLIFCLGPTTNSWAESEDSPESTTLLGCSPNPQCNRQNNPFKNVPSLKKGNPHQKNVVAMVHMAQFCFGRPCSESLKLLPSNFPFSKKSSILIGEPQLAKLGATKTTWKLMPQQNNKLHPRKVSWHWKISIPTVPTGIESPFARGLWKVHPWKLTWHWKIPMFKQQIHLHMVMTWWIFQCHVSFMAGILQVLQHLTKSNTPITDRTKSEHGSPTWVF